MHGGARCTHDQESVERRAEWAGEGRALRRCCTGYAERERLVTGSVSWSYMNQRTAWKRQERVRGCSGEGISWKRAERRSATVVGVSVVNKGRLWRADPAPARVRGRIMGRAGRGAEGLTGCCKWQHWRLHALGLGSGGPGSLLIQLSHQPSLASMLGRHVRTGP